MPLILQVLVVLLLSLIGSSVFLWALRIRPFIREHGRKLGPVRSLAALQDYSTAKEIARESCYTPWFVCAFGWLVGIQLVVFCVWIVVCLTLD